MLTGLDPDATRQLRIDLIDVGLGEDMGYDHLRLDPGLAPYLLGELTADEAETLHTQWAQAMAQLTEFIYAERFKDAQWASQLILLELPNLLAMLDRLQTHLPPEQVVPLAVQVEALVQDLGRPQALAQATRIREQAAQHLGGWSRARYLAEAAQIDHLFQRGDLQAAHITAQHLLTQCLAAGVTAYPYAAYDIATAHFRLGRALQMSGAAEAALTPLAEAQRRFQELADTGNKDAEGMVAATVTETGACLLDLDRLDGAAEAYEEQIRRAPSLGDLRGAAVAKAQLGAVRIEQQRYTEALQNYAEARETFEALGEPLQVAITWHQTGRAYQGAGQFESSEHAYLQALAIKVRENDLPGQAGTLGQLGNLYYDRRRMEDAATFFRQAADIDVRSGNMVGEGRKRYNLAHTLLMLRRYDEARQELQRAIECEKPYGHAAEPWKAWTILEDLERATGNADEAQAARNRAIETYLAYRRAGGHSQSNQIQLFSLIAQATHQNTQNQVARQLNNLLEPDAPPWFTALVQQLQSILAGDHDPTHAADTRLDYMDAAELLLLLETLDQQNPNRTRN